MSNSEQKQIEQLKVIKMSAERLVEQMRKVHSSKEYIGVYHLWQNHFGPYSGPQYASEFADLCSALDIPLP